MGGFDIRWDNIAIHAQRLRTCAPEGALIRARVPPCLPRLSEIAVPYFVFDDNGYDVTIASLKGGEVPLDPASLSEKDSIPEVKRFMHDNAGACSACIYKWHACVPPLGP